MPLETAKNRWRRPPRGGERPPCVRPQSLCAVPCVAHAPHPHRARAQDGVHEARRERQAAVHRHGADGHVGREGGGRARVVERLLALLRPVRRPHRHHVHRCRPASRHVPPVPMSAAGPRCRWARVCCAVRGD
eukprot:1297015-Prymnesium_polylepis.1